jgi:hypothetical protein
VVQLSTLQFYLAWEMPTKLPDVSQPAGVPFLADDNATSGCCYAIIWNRAAFGLRTLVSHLMRGKIRRGSDFYRMGRNHARVSIG